MRRLDQESFANLIKRAGVQPRLRRELRFRPELAADWLTREMVAISDRSGNRGVLLIELDGQLYVTAYELLGKIADNQTGRLKPIICDLCYTWQRGIKAARITFVRSASLNAVAFLCCNDLNCSLHVRGLTPEAKLSRLQLPEDMTVDQRVDRLRRRLNEIVGRLGLNPVV
jgi:hypothetical protein